MAVRLEAFGARVDLTGDSGAVDEIVACLGSFLAVTRDAAGAPAASVAVSDPSGDSAGTVHRDGELVAEEADRTELVRRALSEVHLAVAVHATDAVFIHAGVVSWRGAGIAIPGRSMTGKTTLVTELVRAGASYMSDEYAVVDTEGFVHPYPKLLSVRGPGGTQRVDPQTVGAVETGRVPLAVVLDTTFVSGSVWSPEAIAGARVVLPLIDNAVVAQLEPMRVLDVTTVVARKGAVVLSGERGEAHAAAEGVLERLELLADRTTPDSDGVS
ncbi:MAG: hypothetical protein ACK5O2_05860 [Microthrixaceae bacterium]